jgi:hypothetical protein
MQLSKQDDTTKESPKKQELDHGKEKEIEKDKEKAKERSVVEIEYPAYWEAQDSDQQVFKVKKDRYRLQMNDQSLLNSMEYKSILERFSAGMPSSEVHKIERNQNKKLWMWYQLQKQEVAKGNKGHANEKVLHFEATTNGKVFVSRKQSRRLSYHS